MGNALSRSNWRTCPSSWSNRRTVASPGSWRNTVRPRVIAATVRWPSAHPPIRGGIPPRRQRAFASSGYSSRSPGSIRTLEPAIARDTRLNIDSFTGFTIRELPRPRNQRRRLQLSLGAATCTPRSERRQPGLQRSRMPATGTPLSRRAAPMPRDGRLPER